MLIRRLLFTTLALLATRADGQPTLMLPIQANAIIPAGTQRIPAAASNTYASAMQVDQLVIPRYRSGSNHPAGLIYGVGPQSIIAATANTQNQSGFKAVIKTEEYGSAISQWQSTSAGTQPAVLQPHLVNCTVAGYTTNAWGQGGDVNDHPNQHNVDDPDLYSGFLGQANGGLIDNVVFFFIPGTGLEVRHNESQQEGSFKPHDRQKWLISRVNCRRVFRGIFLDAHNSGIADIEVEAYRDYGMKLGSGDSGNIQFNRIHVYGGGYSGEPNGSGGAAIWIDGDDCHGGQIYPENSQVGLLVTGDRAAVDGVYSHTCLTANVVVDGSNNRIAKCQIECHNGSIGYKSNGANNSLYDAYFTCPGDPATTVIKIENGSNQMIRATIDAFGDSNPVAIDADDTLNDCVIYAHIIGGAKGIDLDDNGGGIGDNNYIWITTDGTTDPFDLPAGWSTTPTSTTNWVFVNGTRYYPP